MKKFNPTYIISNLDTVTPTDIEQLYNQFNIGGSGPISMMRVICGLLEQIYQLKGFGILNKLKD